MAAKQGTAKDQRVPGRPFEPGKSGNPKGRPPGETVGDALRAKTTPQVRANMLLKLARTAKSEQVKLAATLAVLERADGRAPQTVDLTVKNEEAAPVDWGTLPLERRKELLAGLSAADEVAEPAGTDGEGTPEG